MNNMESNEEDDKVKQDVLEYLKTLCKANADSSNGLMQPITCILFGATIKSIGLKEVDICCVLKKNISKMPLNIMDCNFQFNPIEHLSNKMFAVQLNNSAIVKSTFIIRSAESVAQNLLTNSVKFENLRKQYKIDWSHIDLLNAICHSIEMESKNVNKHNRFIKCNIPMEPGNSSVSSRVPSSSSNDLNILVDCHNLKRRSGSKLFERINSTYGAKLSSKNVQKISVGMDNPRVRTSEKPHSCLSDYKLLTECRKLRLRSDGSTSNDAGVTYFSLLPCKNEKSLKTSENTLERNIAVESGNSSTYTSQYTHNCLSDYNMLTICRDLRTRCDGSNKNNMINVHLPCKNENQSSEMSMETDNSKVRSSQKPHSCLTDYKLLIVGLNSRNCVGSNMNNVTDVPYFSQLPRKNEKRLNMSENLFKQNINMESDNSSAYASQKSHSCLNDYKLLIKCGGSNMQNETNFSLLPSKKAMQNFKMPMEPGNLRIRASQKSNSCLKDNKLFKECRLVRKYAGSNMIDFSKLPRKKGKTQKQYSGFSDDKLIIECRNARLRRARKNMSLMADLPYCEQLTSKYENQSLKMLNNSNKQNTLEIRTNQKICSGSNNYKLLKDFCNFKNHSNIAIGAPLNVANTSMLKCKSTDNNLNMSNNYIKNNTSMETEDSSVSAHKLLNECRNLNKRCRSIMTNLINARDISKLPCDNPKMTNTALALKLPDGHMQLTSATGKKATLPMPAEPSLPAKVATIKSKFVNYILQPLVETIKPMSIKQHKSVDEYLRLKRSNSLAGLNVLKSTYSLKGPCCLTRGNYANYIKMRRLSTNPKMESGDTSTNSVLENVNLSKDGSDCLNEFNLPKQADN